MTWGKQGAEPGEFHFPIGIAITPADEILVTDHHNNRVQKFSTDGKLLSHFPVLPNPGGIALDKSGNIYLSHFSASVIRRKEVHPDRLTVYSAAGKRLHEWGKTGAGHGEFNHPGGMVIAPNGRLYVADQTNHRIQVLDLDGRFLAAWGKHGTKPGDSVATPTSNHRAGGPVFIAIDKQGNVYTTEAMDGRVQNFTPDGAYLAAFGDHTRKVFALKTDRSVISTRAATSRRIRRVYSRSFGSSFDIVGGRRLAVCRTRKKGTGAAPVPFYSAQLLRESLWCSVIKRA